MSGAPAKVQAGINSLVEKGIAAEWDIDVRVTNAFLGVSMVSSYDSIVSWYHTYGASHAKGVEKRRYF